MNVKPVASGSPVGWLTTSQRSSVLMADWMFKRNSDEVDACAEGREGPPRPRLPVVSTGEEQLHLPEVILGAAVESGTGKREHAAGADARREVILTKPINRECIFELLVWKQDTGIEAVADHALVGRAHARLRADLAGRADKDEQRAGDPKGAARAKDTI